MDLYFTAILIFIIGIIVITPLTIERNFFKYSLPLFFSIIILVTLFRPYMPEGIDNRTFIEYLSNSDLKSNNDPKMFLIYYLGLLVPESWNKLYVINFLSSSISILSFRKIFKELKKESTSKFLILLYLIYFLTFSPLLILVHLKQYLGFGLLSILYYFYSIDNKKNLKYELIVSILAVLSHIVYLPFIFIFFFLKYFGNKIINFWRKSSSLNKLIYILLFIIYLLISYVAADKLYITVSKIIPGYLSYGIQKIQNFSVGLSIFYPYILVFPVILFNVLGNKRKDKRDKFLLGLITYFLISIPITLIEYKLPFLYGVGRVKSGIYPIIFLLLYELKDKKISKFNSIPLLITSYFICIQSLLRSIQYLNP